MVLPTARRRGRAGAARARRRPRARDAARRLPQRDLPDAADRHARAAVVQPRPARDRSARRLPALALAAALGPPLHRHRRHRFADVIAGCADPSRPGGWITPAIRVAYERLHALGWAHSLEVWDAGGALAGGLYGVEIGGLFAAESKFHVRTDASKVALAALGERLRDVQWTTPHLLALGARDVARAEYLRRLRAALGTPPAF